MVLKENLFYVYECYAVYNMYVYHAVTWLQRKSEEGFGYAGPEVMDSWESPCACWESNSDLLQEQ